MPKTNDDALEAIKNVFIEFGAYIFTVLGVLFSQYVPILRESLSIPMEKLLPTASELIGACVVALIVAIFLEDREKDHFSNVKSKFARYFLYGIAWSEMFSSILG